MNATYWIEQNNSFFWSTTNGLNKTVMVGKYVGKGTTA